MNKLHFKSHQLLFVFNHLFFLLLSIVIQFYFITNYVSLEKNLHLMFSLVPSIRFKIAYFNSFDKRTLILSIKADIKYTIQMFFELDIRRPYKILTDEHSLIN